MEFNNTALSMLFLLLSSQSYISIHQTSPHTYPQKLNLPPIFFSPSHSYAMVNLHRNQYLAATLLLSLLILLISSSSSSARPLNDFSQLAATSNLELPSDRVVVMRPEKKAHVSVVACGGKVHGPFILNMLPKGTVPPSAPSKRHNNINN